MIVDMWGVFTYSRDITTVLQKYHGLLKDEGSVYIKVHNVRGRTTILQHEVNVNGVKIRLVEDWLPLVKGFDFIYYSNQGVIRLIKNTDPLYVPVLLLESASGAIPPVRYFIQQ